MSRDYGKIVPRFWTGDTGKSMRGRLDLYAVASYLVSGPHAHMIGVYYLPIAYICHDLGLTEAVAEECLIELENRQFVQIDRESEWVWVKKMAFIQIAPKLKATDNRVKGIVKELDKVPERFKRAFRDCYEGPFNLPPDPCLPPSKPLRSQEQEQEQEQEEEQDQDQKQEQDPLPLTSVKPLSLTDSCDPWKRGDPISTAGDLVAAAAAYGGPVGAGATPTARGLASKICPVPEWEYQEALDQLDREGKQPNAGLLGAVILRRRREAEKAASGGAPAARTKPRPGRGWDLYQEPPDDD